MKLIISDTPIDFFEISGEMEKGVIIMLFIWNRKEIYNGFSIKEFNRIKDILSQKGIKYDYKTVNLKSSSLFDSTRGRVGSMGENLDASYEYYLYVNKKEYDEAIFAISTSKKAAE